VTRARALLEDTTAALAAAPSIENPSVEARWIVERVVGKSHAELVGFDPELSPEVVAEVEAFVRRRKSGEPLQYIIGLAGFRTLELEVGPGVFIPRPETEVVAGRAMDLLPQAGTIVDVGTGSGAIALAVAIERPDASVFATERSAEALSWARRNAERLSLTVHFMHSAYLDELPESLKGVVDVVVSNPPYIDRAEQGRLPVNVVEHEPHEALFSSHDGLTDIQRIAEDARNWLTPEGWLVMEIGETQGSAALAVLNDLGYRSASVDVDLTGRDRVAIGKAPA
jgi:release factor glutamine methyltransferase